MPQYVALAQPVALGLSTAPEASARDGAAALALCEAMLSALGPADGMPLALQAAALAELGRFPDAERDAVAAERATRRRERERRACRVRAAGALRSGRAAAPPRTMNRPSTLRRTALAALLLGLAACSEPRRPNVLFVVVDTLRADRVGESGRERGVTPYLQRFAEGATRFEACHAHAPWTLPSCAAILSGRHPAEHGAGGNLGDGMRRLADGVETLPGVFGAAGYRTHAIVNVAFLGEQFGVTREFGGLDAVHFDSNTEVRRAETTTDAALEGLGEAGDAEPFLLFVHYFDPHAVYDPPQPFRRNFALPQDRDDASWVFGTRQQMMALRAGRLRPDAATLRRAEALYDGEVAYTDAALGRLLDGLAALDLDDDTVVVITGDHGEEFGDHGGFEHGHTVYDELTHVRCSCARPAGRPGPSPRMCATWTWLRPCASWRTSLPRPASWGAAWLQVWVAVPLEPRPCWPRATCGGRPSPPGARTGGSWCGSRGGIGSSTSRRTKASRSIWRLRPRRS